MRLVGDMIEWCTEHMPRWHPISISGYHIREAGSTAQQELAFTLKDGFTYVEQAIERGLDVDAFAPRLSFFFNAHIDFFEEIAKYRAARRIWAREMRDTYGAKREESWRMRFHTQTAGVSLTAQQPQVNIIRTAIEALAGVLGGTQSLHTNSYDEALALPTEQAVRIALRTQQVIAHETGVTNTIDPLGGSYFVETLTDEMERAAYEYFARIDELGGMVEAIKQNFPQREIADASFRYQQEVDSKRRIVVGRQRLRALQATRRLRSCGSIPSSSASRRGGWQATQGAARLGRGGASPRRAEGGRRYGRQSDAADPRLRARPGLRGRDGRGAPAGLRLLHRAARLLANARPLAVGAEKRVGHPRPGARWYEYRYVRRGKPGRIAGLVALVVLLGAGVAYAADQGPLGVIGPSTGIQPSGRQLHPAGRLTQLGNLPTGGVLTPNGRYLWALSTGRGRNDVRIVQVAKTLAKGGQEEGEEGQAAEAKQIGSKRCNRVRGSKSARLSRPFRSRA